MEGGNSKHLSLCTSSKTIMNLKSLFHKSPQGSWQIILSIAVALLIALVLVDIWMFVNVRSTSVPPLKEEFLEKSRFDLGKLRRTLLYYENKKKEFDNTTTSGKVRVQDPSI